MTVGFEAQIPPLPKNIMGKSLKQKILTSFKEKPLMESLGKALGTADKP